MNLVFNRMVLYNRLILYNRTISSLVLFIFTGVTFGVFNIIYFCSALMALDIGWFWWWMCRKNEVQTKVLSLKSSNLNESFKTLQMLRNRTAAQKSTQDYHKSDMLAQTNQLKYDCFFGMAQETHIKFLKI